ncbi:hypothetical protein [Paracoccus sp. JM45]|uniref:hypothetical protein n=1 Tax=Paracoccus sp. JM45 TaxID=2283626 RepID=UPI000E6C5EFC|nr:hypothetical protein DWB67_13920 [Paracoccus sp. JM45]
MKRKLYSAELKAKVALTRFSLYDHPRGESAGNLVFLEILETRWYFSRQIARHMQREAARAAVTLRVV